MKCVYIHNAGTPIHEICLSMSIINNADETRCADPNGPATPQTHFLMMYLKGNFFGMFIPFKYTGIQQECMFLLSQIW